MPPLRPSISPPPNSQSVSAPPSSTSRPSATSPVTDSPPSALGVMSAALKPVKCAASASANSGGRSSLAARSAFVVQRKFDSANVAAPPQITSMPASPSSRSLPTPPTSRSSDAPPIKMSLPRPPKRSSAPPEAAAVVSMPSKAAVCSNCVAESSITEGKAAILASVTLPLSPRSTSTLSSASPPTSVSLPQPPINTSAPTVTFEKNGLLYSVS